MYKRKYKLSKIKTIMFTLTGIFGGLVKNLLWVGFSIVDSLLFMWVFNYLAPDLIEWGVPLPVDNIGWWFSLSLFLLIGFIVKFIATITPTIIKIDNSTKTDKS